jgi:hypothetical protein
VHQDVISDTDTGVERGAVLDVPFFEHPVYEEQPTELNV